MTNKQNQLYYILIFCEMLHNKMNQAGDKKFILRLSKYKRVLQQFKALGMERVFSNNLGDAIDVTPTTVRKDFAELNIPGSKRGGYVIDEVLDRKSVV